MTISRSFALLLTSAAVAASLASSAVAATPPAERDGTVIKWHGKERTAQLPVGPEMIPGAPRSFRQFARQELRRSWIEDLDHRPACRLAPTMTVRSLRTDGFALGGFGTYPQPGCETGGGYAAFWAIRHGQWKQVIATQDFPGCARLEQVGFPSELGVPDCYDGHDIVPYNHA
jgi:hypothetical protein